MYATSTKISSTDPMYSRWRIRAGMRAVRYPCSLMEGLVVLVGLMEEHCRIQDISRRRINLVESRSTHDDAGTLGVKGCCIRSSGRGRMGTNGSESALFHLTIPTQLTNQGHIMMFVVCELSLKACCTLSCAKAMYMLQRL